MSIVDDYIQWQSKQRNRTFGTLRVYSLILRHYMHDVVGERPLDHVVLSEMETWVQRKRLREGAGCVAIVPSAGTIARDVTIVRGLYKWAHARGLIATNPAHELYAPTPKNIAPRPISDETWAAWWQAPLTVEMRAVLALGYFGGLRLNELATLKCEHIVTERDIRIANLVRKGGGEHTISLETGVEAILKRLPWLWHPDTPHPLDCVRATSVGSGLFLPWVEHYEDRNRAQQVSRYIHRSGRWYELPRFTPHQLRHSCATNLVRAGVPLPMVARYMNHSDMTTTMRYARSAGDEMREWLNGPQ